MLYRILTILIIFCTLRVPTRTNQSETKIKTLFFQSWEIINHASSSTNTYYRLFPYTPIASFYTLVHLFWLRMQGGEGSEGSFTIRILNIYSLESRCSWASLLFLLLLRAVVKWKFVIHIHAYAVIRKVHPLPLSNSDKLSAFSNRSYFVLDIGLRKQGCKCKPTSNILKKIVKK
jgi:hypothetical protein